MAQLFAKEIDFQGSTPQRRALLKTLMVVTCVGGLLFFVINTRRGLHLLANIELAVGIASMFLYWVIGRTRRLFLWTVVFLYPFLAIMMLAMILPGTSPTVFLWIYIVPILCHLLLGRYPGLFTSILFILIALGIYFFKHGADPGFITAVGCANIMFSLLCTLAFAHAYEYTSETARRKLLEMASTDPLTGLANLYRFQESFEHERRRAERLGSRLCLLVLDLDWFKRVNDTHGHQVGDQVLCHVAGLLRQRLRGTDLPCRVGGEEFTVLLPDTGLPEAEQVAETLRLLVAGEPFVDGSLSVSLTCSIGVAEWGSDGQTLENLFEVADARLYIAKQNGRNRVIVRDQPAAGLSADSAVT